MSDDILKEIREVKETLTFLTERVRQLEQRVTTSSSASAVSVSVQAPKSAAPSVPAPQRLVSAVPKAGRENLELNIGRYWLNRIGIFTEFRINNGTFPGSEVSYGA